MKKIGLLALAIVLALGTMGAGFAYWNETLTIKDTNLNTGDFAMEWINWYSKSDPSYCWPQATSSCVGSTATATVKDSTTIEVNVRNLYPGCGFKFWAHGRNSGTIPAKFDRVDITVVEDDHGVANYLYVNPGDTYISWDPDGNGPQGHHCRCPVPSSCKLLFIDLDDCINQGGVQPGCQNCRKVANFILEPQSNPGDPASAGKFALGDLDDGECVSVYVDANAPNSIEGATFKFKFEMTFKVFNK